MFDKNKFAKIIKDIYSTFDTQREFSKKTGVSRTYLSEYMNMKKEKPPSPKILIILFFESSPQLTSTVALSK